MHTFLSILVPVLTAGPQLSGDPATGARPSLAGGAFLENRGQWPAQVRFLAREGALALRLEQDGFFLQVLEPGAALGAGVRHGFRDADAAARMEPEIQLPGIHSFFLGEDPAGWRTGVRGFGAVVYRGVREGIDVRFHHAGGRLKYDVLVAPGADLERFAIETDGALALRVAGDGALLMDTQAGVVRHEPPVAWEVLPCGGRRSVDSSYRLLGDASFGFAAAGRDPDLPLVIDPGITWSTFLGGSSYDYANDVAVTSHGVTVAGYTDSPNFPATAGSFQARPGGGTDGFVARLDASGSSLVWAAYLGGGLTDEVRALAVDAAGHVTVCGETQSRNFPTTPGAFDRTGQGGGDAFVARIDASGAALSWSTYLGGSDWDEAAALALLPDGRTMVVGWTRSTDFPTTPGAFDRTYNGGGDAFVSQLDASGARLLWSTYFGGAEWDPPYAVAADASGQVTVAGETYGVAGASTFPTTPGAFQTRYAGGRSDGWVARFDASGSRLVFSTFLGGDSWDPIRGLALGPDGSMAVAGETWSTDFPTTPGAFDRTYRGGGDAFAARLDAAGANLLAGTYLGGGAWDAAYGLAMDGAGRVTVAGITRSADLPATPGAYATSHGGSGDAFVARFSTDMGALWYLTYLGASAYEIANAVALDGDLSATVAGEVWSAAFPTTPGAFDRTYNGAGDAFVTRLDMLPVGVERYGASTPACGGPQSMEATAMARPGALFGAACVEAPPSAAGLFLLGAGRLAAGFPVLGADLWVDPLLPLVVLAVASDPWGGHVLPLPVPPGTSGARVFLQYVWLNTAACGGLGTLSASDALQVTVQ